MNSSDTQQIDKPTPRAAAKEAGREAVLAAALHLFASNGFDATAVPAIAKRAGVSTGSVYVYFPEKKEGLVNALYRRCKRQFLNELVDSIRPQDDFRKQFADLWAALRRFATTERETFVFLEMHFHAPYLDAESLAVEAEVLGFARALVEQGMQTGALEVGDPDLIITLIFGAFVELIKQQQLGRLKKTVAVFRAAEDKLWRMIAR